MKRLLSVSLAMLMALSSLFAALAIVSVAAADDNSTITFDEPFYTDTTGINLATLEKNKFSGTEHGNVAKFNTISAHSDRWPNAVRIADSTGKAAYSFKKNTRYKISLDIKKDKADNAFNIYLFALNNIEGLGGITTNNNKYFYYEWIGAGASDWITITKTVDANFFDGDETNLAIALYRSKTQYKNQEIYIDNIKVEKVGKLAKITAHNNNGTDNTVKTYITTDTFSSIPAPDYHGKTFDGWYLDEGLTERAVGTIGSVGSDDIHIYAKWLDYATADKTVIDFEMPGVVERNSDGQLTYRAEGADEAKVIATGSGTSITETTDADGNKTNAINFVEAMVMKNRWPVMFLLYDSKQESLGANNYNYKPRANSVYKISLKYRVDGQNNYALNLQLRNFNNLTNPGYDENNIYLNELAVINGITDGWQTAEAYFFTGESPMNTGLALVSTTVGTKPKNVDVWVDDIVIEEMTGSQKVVFETNGGTAVKETMLFSENLGNYTIPEKEGYIFAGWYTDSALTQVFNINDAPDGDIKLYAKWEPKSEKAKKFESGFEPSEFEGGKAPYNNGTTDNNSDKSVSWVTDDDGNAYSGLGRLELVNKDGVYTENSKRWLSAALMNKDGSYYQVVKGVRYKYSFYYYVNNPENPSVVGQTLILGTSSSVPSFTLNANNINAIYTLTNSGAKTKDNGNWYYCEGTFEADKTEKLYFAAYTSNKEQVIAIDDVSVTPAANGEVVKVSYYSDKTSETPIYSAIGIPGEIFTAAYPQKADGKIFAGWVDDSNRQYIDNTLPSSDLKLYATWESAPKAEPVYLDEAECDFEDQSNAKAFYGDANNIYADRQIDFKTNLPNNAHGGNGYLSITDAGHWIKAYYRTVKFYNSATPDNKIWLEPGGIYKIGYWIKVDKCTGGTNLYLAGFNEEYADADGVAPYTILSENYMDAASAFTDNGEWIYKEYFVLNDELPSELGFVLYGGYLSASIDDISVVKLKNVTVSFDSNGGTSMAPISTLTYNTVMDPGESQRYGYYFDGWYWDKALTKKFNFVVDYVTENTTLYAKWLPWQYKTEITGYDEQEKTVIIPAPELADEDKPVTFTQNDRIGKIKKNNSSVSKENTSLPIWAIILIIVGAAVAVIAIGLTVLLIAKKKKKRGGNKK